MGEAGRPPQRRDRDFALARCDRRARQGGVIRHCERSEAIQADMTIWIASSLTLLAMRSTGRETRHCERSEAIQAEVLIWIASSLTLLAMTRDLKWPYCSR